MMGPLVVTLILLVPWSGGAGLISEFYKLLVVVTAALALILSVARGKVGLVEAVTTALLSALLLNVIFVGPYTGINILETASLAAAILLIQAVNLVNPQGLAWIVKSIIVVGLLNFFIGLLQYMFDIPILGKSLLNGRMTGLVAWQNTVVGSLLGIAFVALTFTPLTDRKLLIAYLLFVLCLLLTGGRSFIVASVPVVFLYFARLGVKSALGFLLCSVALLVVFYGFRQELLEGLRYFFSENIAHRFDSLFGNFLEEQETKRFATWMQTACLIADYPLGVPVGLYPEILEDYFHCAGESEGTMPHPHNAILDLLVNFGFSTAILMTIVYGWMLTVYIDKRRLLLLRGPFFAFGILISPFNTTHGLVSAWWSILVFITLGLAICVVQLRNSNATLWVKRAPA